MPSRIPLIFGGASFGTPNTNTTRVHTLPEAQKFVDVAAAHGIKVYDTSRIYGYGSSEEFFGKLDVHGGLIDTKINPVEPGYFAPENLRKVFQQSVDALAPHKIRVFYLHLPDRSDKAAPFEDVLRQINEFHKAGLIEEFGLSNFKSWEVAEFVFIARKNGWIQPTVYQGVYNAVERTIEAELIPCLRKYGIRFYAYSPLAGGLLVGKNLSDDVINYQPGSRWDAKSSDIANFLTQRYAPLLPIFRELKVVLANHKIELAQAAQRWLQHHSAIGPEDAVIIGASSLSQLESNIADCEGGPLPEEVVNLFDQAWGKAKSVVAHYSF